MNKDISKAIMNRKRLRHKVLRSPLIEEGKSHNKEIIVFHLVIK